MKYMLRVLVGLVLVGASVPVWAGEDHNFVFTTTSGEASIIGYDTSGTDLYSLTVPSVVTDGSNTFTVTSIWGDLGSYLTAVAIPSSVTLLADGAFADSAYLGTVDLVHGLKTIKGSAFRECHSLTNISLPDSVTRIEDAAFQWCTALPRITIPGGSAYVGADVFAGCSNLVSVTIDSGVSDIGVREFAGCASLTNLVIPGSVSNIWDDAFNGCASLPAVSFPATIALLREGAFANCTSLTNVVIPRTLGGIEPSVFSGCSRLASVTIGTNIIYISSAAFADCTSLKSLALPDSLDSLGEESFARCTGLTSITIPSNMSSLVTAAFTGCTSLASITLAGDVGMVMDDVFAGCTSLTNVLINGSINLLGSRVFAGCPNLTGVYFTGDAPLMVGSDLFAGDTQATVYYLAGTTGWGPTFGGRPTALWSKLSTVAMPAISPNGGTFTSSQTVTLSCTTPNAAIRYTTNGSDPVKNSTLYSTPFVVSSTSTIKAKAFLTGYVDSAVASATFTISTPITAAAMPTATPPSGARGTNAVIVTLRSATSGAIIHYAINDIATSNSPIYKSAITLTNTCVLQAIACKTKMANSPVLSAGYVVINVPLAITPPSSLVFFTKKSNSTQLTAIGGTPPYKWSWTADRGSVLPAGLTLSATGLIAGKPTKTNTCHVTLKVTDAKKQPVSLPVTVYIYAAP